MRTVCMSKMLFLATALAVLLLCAAALHVAEAQNAQPSKGAGTLSPAPQAQAVPQPAAATDKPYAPQPILQGGIVVTLFPPDSPFVRKDKIREAEKYNMNK